MSPAKALAAPKVSKMFAGIPLSALSELAVPLAVLAIVVALITPLPGFVLDLLIVTDILASVTVLMVSLYLVRPVEFTSFPTTLLLLTLFRLALNVSSSRLIWSETCFIRASSEDASSPDFFIRTISSLALLRSAFNRSAEVITIRRSVSS